MKKVIFLFAMIFAVSMAMAQNTINLTQTGSDNESENTQGAGNGNLADIDQIGDENKVVTEQFGDNNMGTIIQGDENNAKILQGKSDANGSGNTGIINQDEGHTANIEQIEYYLYSGHLPVSNKAEIRQTKQDGGTSGAWINQYGESNEARIDQTGVSRINVTLRGNSNFVGDRYLYNGFGEQINSYSGFFTRFFLTGNDNNAGLYQVGATDAWVSVTGNSNTTNVLQNGGTSTYWNRVDIQLQGDDNDVDVLQVGYGNDSKVMTYPGNNNTVTHDFDGNVIRGATMIGYTGTTTTQSDGNTATQTSVGNNNTTWTRILGNDNTLTTDQLGSNNKIGDAYYSFLSGYPNPSDYSENALYGIIQKGDGNTAELRQWSNGNTSFMKQVGDENTARLQQTDGGNASIWQNGYQNLVAGIDAECLTSDWAIFTGTSLLVDQDGSKNKLYLNASGSVDIKQDNSATAEADREGNTIKYFKSGTGITDIDQVGDGNGIGLIHGGTGDVDINQSGNNNKVASFVNVFAADPVMSDPCCGTFNGVTLDVDQINGSDNLLHLNSTGSFDIVTVMQNGSNNVASATQSTGL
jgi:hypothetical protein